MTENKPTPLTKDMKAVMRSSDKRTLYFEEDIKAAVDWLLVNFDFQYPKRSIKEEFPVLFEEDENAD